ncbi:hypothetical protein V6N13_078283 [Hibiscus sabdariffa]|uniref:Gnk2-homologous domain-containing protein n=1 Tax=Hibiscus sabdariffa TaxID=183260 RepID=A0ABR2RN38_9ROSI
METRSGGTLLDNYTVMEEDDFVDMVALLVKDVASEAAGCITLQSQRGCNLCLQDAITQFSDYFRQKQEATRASSLLPSCNVQYGSTPFYNKTTETFSLVDAAVRCYDTGNFTTNSTYAHNRDLLLASLLPNVSANGGFYTESVGQVYALGMCRGDSTPDGCYTFLNSSIQDLISSCPNQKEAISWGVNGPYIARYSDRPFFGILELEPTDAGYNRADITSNLTEFDIVWESLMGRVVRKASNGTSSLKYATGEAEFTAFQKIYAVMQCTPDLSNKDCDSCLRATVSYFESCCHGKQGGYVQKPTCWFRWDLYPFYVSNASTSVPSLSPPPPPASPPPQSVNSTNTKERGGSSSRTLVIIVVPIVIVVAVLVILAVAVLLRRIKKTKKDDQIYKTRVESLQFDFNDIRVATDNFATRWIWFSL